MASVGELYCVNVVAVCNIGVWIDIADLVRRFPYAYLQPQEFPAAAIHFENPRLTFLVSSMGKIVIIGSQNKYANIIAARQFIEILDYPKARIKSIQIQNYTCTYIFNGVLDLPRLAASDPSASSTSRTRSRAPACGPASAGSRTRCGRLAASPSPAPSPSRPPSRA